MKIRIVTLALLSLVIGTPSFAQTNEDAKAAFADVSRKCVSVLQPFANLTALIYVNGVVTPAMLANNNYATDSEAETLRNFLPAFQTCQGYALEYFKVYFPWNVAIADEKIRKDTEVLGELAAKKLTYADANRKLADISAEFAAASKSNTEKERRARLAGGGNLPPAQLAGRAAIKHDCEDAAELYAGGMLVGKIPLRAGEPTAEMMADETYPTEAAAVALRGYLNIFKNCRATEREYYKAWEPWMLPVETYIQDGYTPILISLTDRQITYGMANRSFANVAKEASAKEQALIKSLAAKGAAQNGAPVPSESDVAGALGGSAN